MERKDEGTDEDGEIQTEHERDDMDNRENMDRLQVEDDDDNDSPAFTGGNITRYRALAALTCRKIDQICIDAGVLCDGEAVSAGHGACQEDRKAKP